MTWNYRIIKEVVPGFGEELVDAYGVHEVYYDAEGKPTMCSEAIQPYGETLDELKVDLERMMEAFEKPVLDMVQFKTKEELSKE